MVLAKMADLPLSPKEPSKKASVTYECSDCETQWIISRGRRAAGPDTA